jgi:ribosomal protein S8
MTHIELRNYFAITVTIISTMKAVKKSLKAKKMSLSGELCCVKLKLSLEIDMDKFMI